MTLLVQGPAGLFGLRRATRRCRKQIVPGPSSSTTGQLIAAHTCTKLPYLIRLLDPEAVSVVIRCTNSVRKTTWRELPSGRWAPDQVSSAWATFRGPAGSCSTCGATGGPSNWTYFFAAGDLSYCTRVHGEKIVNPRRSCGVPEPGRRPFRIHGAPQSCVYRRGSIFGSRGHLRGFQTGRLWRTGGLRQ